MRRREAIGAGMLLGLGALLATPASAGKARERLVYFGTQGTEAGQGIVAARLDERTGKLSALGTVAELERPTWIVISPDGRFLYSVSEIATASVHAFAIDRATGALTPLGKVMTGGAGATHLALDPRSDTLFVAHYDSGHVVTIPVRADGGLDPVASTQLQVGSGPSRRQKSAHPHGVVLDPGGRFALVADLGADKTFVYRFDPATRALTPHDPAFTASPPGSGPRHIAFLPGGRFVYVNKELTREVTGYRWDGAVGRMTELATVSTHAPGYAGTGSTAELAASSDGRFLYGSNRGDEHMIVAWRVDRTTGALAEIQRVPSGGQTPWSFGIDPSGKWMLVANQGSGNVAVYRRDPKTGTLTATAETLAAFKPTSVAFVP